MNFLFKRISLFCSIILLTAFIGKAADESYLQTLSGKIKKGDSLLVADDKFLSLPLNQWNQIQNLSVDNILTFELRNDTSFFYQQKNFTCSLTVAIQYFTSRDQQTPTIIDSVTLAVKYDTAHGSVITTSVQYPFKNAFKVLVIVKSISSPEWGENLPAVFRIKSQILVSRLYAFSDEVTAPIQLLLGKSDVQSEENGLLKSSRKAAGLGSSEENDLLKIFWKAADFGNSEEYDVEWKFIDKKSEYDAMLSNPANIQNEDVAGWMRFDNTRVTVNPCHYNINLPYTDGYVIVRVRGARFNPNTQLRETTNWQYRNEQGALAFVEIEAHHPNLNWQYNGSFAEEGKRKEVISYFDGSLRSRQMVTVNNSDEKAVAAETVYDNMGRPAMSILPAPLAGSKLSFYPRLNRNTDGVSYNTSDITDGEACAINAHPLSNLSGASQYYSANNPFLNDPNYYFSKYIPDANGYPFTTTQYTPDNTGRIRRQGGVGDLLQIGTGKETRYYYSKPTQKELYRLFGMEVGNASHYQKNAVVDPNGQVSISYIDAAGKTIATALAGIPPPTLDPLKSADENTAKTPMNEVLIQPDNFSVDATGLVMEATSTFFVAAGGPFTVRYNVAPVSLMTSPKGAAAFCTNCYYDILVQLKNECGDIVESASTPPFTANDILCHVNSPNINGSLLTHDLPVGEYTVSYQLRLSEQVVSAQVDYYIQHNSDLTTLQQFFQDELIQADLSGCYSECSTCMEKLGTPDAFAAKMTGLFTRLKNDKYSSYTEFNVQDTGIQNWISRTYFSLLGKCSLMQSGCQPPSPCEMKLEIMKGDVRPGGQYALYTIDEATGLYVYEERSISVLRLYNDPAITDLYNFSYTENGNTIFIRNLSESDFIQAYLRHPEWADVFVKQHIEYCGYEWCKEQTYGPSNNNEASYRFDASLRENITTGQKAEDAGYFDRGNYHALLDKDPFFNGGWGDTYKVRMQNDLLKASDALQMTLVNASGVRTVKNILELVDWMVYCKPTASNADGDDMVNSWTCSPDGQCRSKSAEWEMYRNYYLQLKSNYMEQAKQENKAGCTSCFIGEDGLGDSKCSVNPLFISSCGNICDGNKEAAYGELGAQIFATTYAPDGSGSSTISTGNYWKNVLRKTSIWPCDNRGQTFQWVNYSKPVYIPEDKESYYIGFSGDDEVTLSIDGKTIISLTSPPQGGNIGYYSTWYIYPVPLKRGTHLVTISALNTVGGTPYAMGCEIYDNTSSELAGVTSGANLKILYSTANEVGVNVPCPAPQPSSNCTGDPLYKQNKKRIWNEYTNTQGYQTCQTNPFANQEITDKSAALTSLKQELDNNLAALKTNWLSTLKAVRDEEPAFSGITDTKIADLADKLFEVANRSVELAIEAYQNDQTNSIDPNSIHPTSSLPGNEHINNNHDFNQVFLNVIGVDLIKKGFGADLLNQPYPLGQAPVVVNASTGDLTPDMCNRLTGLRDKFISLQSGGNTNQEFHDWLKAELEDDYTLTADQLQDLSDRCVNGCHLLNEPVMLPVALTSDNTVTCADMNVLVQNFATEYPGVPVGSRLYRVLFENYCNHVRGYALTYDEYRAFQTRCSVNPATPIVLYNKPASPQIAVDPVACEAGILANVFDNAGQKYVIYIEAERKKFRNALIAKCLSNQASARIDGSQYEYHYTLYYYDQAGNLVKTIPPEGVKLLSDDDISLVTTFANENPAACPVNTGFDSQDDPLATFNYFSQALLATDATAAKSMELWLYSTDDWSTPRQMRFITPDHQFMYQIALYDNKIWAELYRLQENAANPSEISITLTNSAVAELSRTPGLQSWTHIFIQSSDGLLSGPLQIFVNGRQLVNLVNGPGYPVAWEVVSDASGYTLPPQLTGAIRQFRWYNRVVTAGEVLNNYKDLCMGPIGMLAARTPLLYWGRLNVGGFCSNLTPTLAVNQSSLATSTDGGADNAGLNMPEVRNNFTIECWLQSYGAYSIFLPSGDVDPTLPFPLHTIVTYPQATTAFSVGTVGIAAGKDGIVVYEVERSSRRIALSWKMDLTGAMVHIAVVYENRMPRLYVNGQLVYSSERLPMYNNVIPSYDLLGKQSLELPFRGILDEFRIWSYARSSEQISAYYSKPISNQEAQGLAGYWPISNENGSYIKDVTCLHRNIPMIKYYLEADGAPQQEYQYINTDEAFTHFFVPDHTLATTYVYNSLNQPVKQQTPDAGTSTFLYDVLGRLVFSQNAQQAVRIRDGNTSNYSYTKYDLLGRIKEVGEMALPFFASGSMTEEEIRKPGVIEDVYNNGFNHQVTVTAYDEQPSWAPSSLVGHQLNLRKRVAATALLEIGNNPLENRLAASYYNYDISGNVAELTQENTRLAMAEKQFINGTTGLKSLRYEYDLISGKVNKVLYQDGKWDQFYYQYLYDADNRVIKSLSSRQNYKDPSLWNTEAKYRYYLHGPLARMELGKNKVQGVDYAYTLQGWLKGVNSVVLDPDKDMSGDGNSTSTFSNNARDAFGFSLGYFDNIYKPIGGTSAQAFTLQYEASTLNPDGPNLESGYQLYNGNISNSTYAIQKLNAGAVSGYTYRYDQLNRLVATNWHNTIVPSAAKWDNTSIDANKGYQERVSYDANGNINTYFRNGASTKVAMDNLAYAYNRDEDGRLLNNKLRHIGDDVPASAYTEDIDAQEVDNYTYDNIGNLKSDKAAFIDEITWTPYGKINSIAKNQNNNSTNINYTYDPSGNRVAKSSVNPIGIDSTFTYYVRDAQGNVLGIYTKNNTTFNWEEQHLYGSSRLGIVTPELQITTGQLLGSDVYNSAADPIANGIEGKKLFELSNHLGNVLATVSDRRVPIDENLDGTIDYYVADVVAAQDYYPFGMMQPGRKWPGDPNRLKYRYGFNGKENDNEVKGEGNQQDYGMRIYDPRVGRFLSVDPLTRGYPNLTPYAFAENDVISSIDLDGLEKYRIVGRSFAPRGSFEGTHFESKADDRTKFEIADYKKVSARIHVQMVMDFDAWTLSKEISSQATIDKVFWIHWPISNEVINATGMGNKANHEVKITADYYAKNGTNIGPGIDIQYGIDMRLIKGDELIVTTKITGNVFPAQETMIFDPKGVGVFLGVSTAKGSPLTGVWGSGIDNKLSLTKTYISVDDKGNFNGVVDWQDGKEIVRSVDDWNQRYTDQDVWDGQIGRVDYKPEFDKK